MSQKTDILIPKKDENVQIMELFIPFPHQNRNENAEVQNNRNRDSL